MHIAVVSYHAGVHGSIINLLDFQQYLRDHEGHTVSFYCKSPRRLRRVVKQSMRPYTFDNLKKITGLVLEKRSVVVTDFKSIAHMYKQGVPIVAKKLVVFDNVELSYHLLNMESAPYYIEVDLDKCLEFHKFEEVEFLMPPVNYVKFRYRYDYPATIFYKKINTDMLKAAVMEGVFESQEYYYKKKEELAYFEQFGRLVFEFTMLGKEVEFEKNPLLYEDGLTDYILHYGFEKLWEKMGGQYDYKPWKL